MKLKKPLSIILSVALLICCFANVNVFAEVDYAQSLRNKGFPESYVTRLVALHELHPNWQFEPVLISSYNSNYTFDYVVNKEYEGKKNLVIVSSWAPSPWNTLGAANYTPYYDTNDTQTYDSGSWRKASKEAIKYFMDPRNFLNEIDVFMFETLQYNSSVQTLSRVTSALQGTFMSGTTMCDNGITYAQHILNCGATYNISPVFLAGRLKSEQGSGGSPLVEGTLGTTLYNYYINRETNKNDTTIWGDVKPTDEFDTAKLLSYDGYYNFFNINAGGSGRFAIYKNAATEAVNAGWNTKAKAIAGGASKIANTYVGDYQDTTYFQKFNVDPRSSRSLWGQYQQGISAPLDEARNTYSTYSTGGVIDDAYKFNIPVYSGMPAMACADPANGNSRYSPSVATTGMDTQITETKTLYRIQCGSYGVLANANNLVTSLKNAGFSANIEQSGTQYQVVEGYYDTQSNANARITQLQNAGFSAVSSTVTRTTYKYIVNITDSSNGTVKLSSDKSYDFYEAGSTVSYTVTPNSGYRVKSITVGGQAVTVTNETSEQAYTFTMSASPTEINVTFEEIAYIVTISSGSGGTAVLGNDTTSRRVKPGVSTSYKITPDSGYAISTITINGKNIYVDKDGIDGTATYWFPMPESDTEINVTFDKLYTAEISVTGSGTASFKNGTSVKFLPGKSVSYTITPDEGYVISAITINDKNVSVDKDGSTGSVTYWYTTLKADTLIEVTISKLYAANITVTGNGTATFKTGLTSGNYIAGNSVSILVTPDDGYFLKSYKINQSIKSIVSNGEAATYWFKMPEQDTDIEFEFAQKVAVGDLNADGIVDMLDLVYMKKCSVGIYQIPSLEIIDVDGNEVFNVIDIIHFKGYFAGKYETLG